MVHHSFVTVEQGGAQGCVRVPTSKSIAHRALICAALCEAGEKSTLCGVPYNEDIDATLDCLSALGVRFQSEADPGLADARRVTVWGCGGRWQTQDVSVLPCRESGSTLRFMLPLCLLSDAPRTLTGSQRLMERPLADYHGLFSGRSWEQGACRLDVGGGQTPPGQDFCLGGKTSSQFVTGLLHILPLLQGDSTVELSCAPESRSYIDMTLAVMKTFGVTGEWIDAQTLCVKGGQRYRPCDMTVDGDASGAAFFEALRALGHGVQVRGIQGRIVQGDGVAPMLLQRVMDAQQALTVISLADCPDLGPILFAVAAVAAQGGKTVVFTHTARLRLKESDRVAAMAGELAKFGADVCTSEDPEAGRVSHVKGLLDASGVDADACGGFVALLPCGRALGAPQTLLHGHNDHRVVMSLAVLCTHVGSGRISDACAVKKSFPGFFDVMRSLGVRVTGDM